MNVKLFDHRGKLLNTKSVNLDSSFFQISPGNNISADDMGAQPYQWHAWTHACAWVIARNISHLPLILVDRETGKEQVKDKWGIIDLFNNPNDLMTRIPFMQFVVLGLLLDDGNRGSGGQVFLTPKAGTDINNGKVDVGGGQIPDVMYPYTDKFYSPIVNKAKTGLGALNGWKFQVHGHTQEYLSNELIRIYLANPYNWLEGLSNFAPSRIAVMQDIKADLYNSSLFDNNATPAGILTSDQLLTPEQREQTMRSWMEEYGGSENAAKVAVMGKGLKFERIALTQQDMQFAETKKNSLEQIIASYGVNKIALGMYEDLNLATIREGRRMLWQDTYLPLGKQIMESINSQWIFNIDPGIALKFDVSEVEALRPDYKDRMEVANRMIRTGVPVELAFRINEIPLTDEDLAKYPWLGEKPVSLSSGSVQVGVGEDESDDKDSKDKKSVIKKLMYETKDAKQEFSKEFIDKILDPGEKELQKKIERFFTSQRNRMQDKVDNWLKTQKDIKVVKDTPSNITPEMFLLDGVNENAALERLFFKPMKDQLLLTESSLDEELGGLVGWNVTDDTVVNYLANRRKVLQGINDTTYHETYDMISDAIEESFAESETVQQTAKRIKTAVGDAIEKRKNHAKTIARTEVGTVTSTARYDAFKKEGIEYSEWVTAMDEAVRESHMLTNGKVELMGQVFTPVGLTHPLQMGAPAEEVINCRCILIAADAPK